MTIIQKLKGKNLEYNVLRFLYNKWYNIILRQTVIKDVYCTRADTKKIFQDV